MKNKNILVVVFIAVLIFLFARTLYKKNKLSNDFIIASGLVLDVGNSYQSGATIFYKFRFQANGKMFFGNTSIPCARKNKSQLTPILINKEMPVVYERGNPDNCEMLFIKAAFLKYNIKIPDRFISAVDSIESICPSDN